MASLLGCRGRKFAVSQAAAVIAAVLSTSGPNLRAQGTANPITIPSSTVAGIGLASAATYQVVQDSQWKDYEDVVILAALNGVAKASANAGSAMTAAAYTSVVNQLRTLLDSRNPQNPVFADEAAVLRYAVDALVPVLSSGTASPYLSIALDGLENLKLTQLENPIDPSRQYPADMGLPSLSASAYSFIANSVQEASDLAHNDPQYAAAIDPVLSDLLGVDSTATYAQIQSHYLNSLPALPAPNPDGSYTFIPQNLVTQYQSVIGGIQTGINADLTSLEAALSASMATPQARDSRPSSSRISAQDVPTAGQYPCPIGPGLPLCFVNNTTTGSNNMMDTAGQGVVTGLSVLVGLSDSQLGKQISSVGGAVVQAGKAIGQLAAISNTAGGILGNLNSGSLGSILGVLDPTGSLIGAGVNIFSSLFGPAAPNPNAAVLAQINMLSQQIARLQTDINAQFAQVNATLNTILTTLNDNFAQIDYTLGVLNGNEQTIQDALLDVQAQLNQIALNLLVYIETQDYETLTQDFNGCLNYAATHNGADIGLTQYNTCENELYTWANSNGNATDPLWAGPQSPDYSDGNIYNFFLNSSITGVCSGCASPFSTDVNYLTQFPAQNLKLQPLSTVRLPNPEVWTLVARAYLELAQQWPQYAATINSARLGNVIQAGSFLQQALHNANSSGSGPSIGTNQPLFNAVGE